MPSFSLQCTNQALQYGQQPLLPVFATSAASRARAGTPGSSYAGHKLPKNSAKGNVLQPSERENSRPLRKNAYANNCLCNAVLHRTKTIRENQNDAIR